MEYFRWIILATGILLVAVIYFTGRSRRRNDHHDIPLNSLELPRFNAIDDDLPDVDNSLVDEVTDAPDDVVIDQVEAIQFTQQEVTTSIEAEPEPETPQISDEDDLVVFHVKAHSAYFTGADLARLLKQQHLVFGDMDIFHAHDENGQVIFSMSNMLKPGHFQADKMDEMRTPGVIFFMQLALLDDPQTGFDRMLHCAKTFARELDAELCDELRKPLNDERLNAIQLKVRRFAKPIPDHEQ